MNRKVRYIVVGAFLGGLLLFVTYYFSTYRALSPTSVARSLVLPTVFGLSAGGYFGHSLATRGSVRKEENSPLNTGESGEKDSCEITKSEDFT